MLQSQSRALHLVTSSTEEPRSGAFIGPFLLSINKYMYKDHESMGAQIKGSNYNSFMVNYARRNGRALISKTKFSLHFTNFSIACSPFMLGSLMKIHQPFLTPCAGREMAVPI